MKYSYVYSRDNPSILLLIYISRSNMKLFDEIRLIVAEPRNHPIPSNERFNRTKIEPLSVTSIDQIGRLEVLLPVSHLFLLCKVITVYNNKKIVTENS